MSCSSAVLFLPYCCSFSQLSYKPLEAEWSRDMRGNLLVTTVALNNVIVISTIRDSSKAEDFMMTLAKIGPPMGISVNPNFQMISLDNDRTDNFVKTIQAHVKDDTQMVSCC